MAVWQASPSVTVRSLVDFERLDTGESQQRVLSRTSSRSAYIPRWNSVATVP